MPEVGEYYKVKSTEYVPSYLDGLILKVVDSVDYDEETDDDGDVINDARTNYIVEVVYESSKHKAPRKGKQFEFGEIEFSDFIKYKPKSHLPGWW